MNNQIIHTKQIYTELFEQNLLEELVFNEYAYAADSHYDTFSFNTEIVYLPCPTDLLEESEQMQLFLEDAVSINLYGTEFDYAPIHLIEDMNKQDDAITEFYENLADYSVVLLRDIDRVLERYRVSHSYNQSIINQPLVGVW